MLILLFVVLGPSEHYRLELLGAQDMLGLLPLLKGSLELLEINQPV